MTMILLIVKTRHSFVLFFFTTPSIYSGSAASKWNKRAPMWQINDLIQTLYELKIKCNEINIMRISQKTYDMLNG